jgi:hypothetical protein
MIGRIAVALAAILASAAPVAADGMKAEEARRFVIGKLFSFSCFEGTAGTGRIYNDGSVAGVIRLQGKSPARFMHLPAGTLYARGDAVCSQLKGAMFQPCFNLTRTSAQAFRGAISGFGFAYCDFVRRGGRGELIRASSEQETGPTAVPRNALRHARAKPQPAAAPTQPVTAEPIAPVADAPMRSSIAP